MSASRALYPRQRVGLRTTDPLMRVVLTSIADTHNAGAPDSIRIRTWSNSSVHVSLIGNWRTRLPVAAKIAFVTAGAMGAVPGSPTPVGLSLLGTI